MRRAVRLALLTVALFVVAPRARAADEGAERDAQARFEEGLQRAKGGDFDAARISFTQAYAVLRRPRILWNLALSEEKTGHTLDALAHFKSVARDPSASDADRSGAQTHVATLYGQTGHIEVRAPVGAPIGIDGGPVVGTTPLSEVLDVAPGRHVVEARLAQGSSAVVVEAAAGEVAVASFMPPPPALAPASAPAPTPAPALAPASAPEPASAGTARIIVVAAAGGVAVAAAVFGVYFGVTSNSNASTAQGLRAQPWFNANVCQPSPGTSPPPMCAQLDDAVKSENRNAGLSTGMYLAAGGLAAAAVVTWFVWPQSDKRQSAVHLWPIVGPGVAGLSGSVGF
jgi:hypothetical protein